MFCYRYLLLSLVAAHQSPFDEENEYNLLIPFNSENIYNGNSGHKCNQDYPFNNNDYSDINQHSLKEREVQEYGDYCEEKEMPNLSKAGLSLFSWWKSESDAKRIKNGTYPPLPSDETSIGISVEPAYSKTVLPNVGLSSTAIPNVGILSAELPSAELLSTHGTNNLSQDSMNISTNGNFSTNPAYQTTYYTITLDCSPISIPDPVICTTLSTINETSTAAVEELKNNATTITDNTTVNSNQTTDTTATGLLNVSAIFVGHAINLPGVAMISPIELQTDRAVFTPPTMFNYLSGGLILPVIQLPMTPVIFINSSISPNTKSIKYHEQPFMIKTTNGSRVHGIKLHQDPLSTNNNRNMSPNPPNAEKTISTVSEYEPAFLSHLMKYTISKYDIKEISNFSYLNNINSTIDTLNSVAAERIYQNVVSNSIGINNQTSGLFRNNEGSLNGKNSRYSQKTVFKPLQKSVEYYPQILCYEKNLIMKKTSGKLKLDEPNTNAPYNQFMNKKINSFNPGGFIISESSNNVNANISDKKTNDQLIENEAVHNNENNYFKGCVKYNETYLSQKVSSNLIALCKNITCTGNDYHAQCCSRMCAPEKCKGEDFSYLQPIPGDTTSTTSTTCCGPFSNINLNRSQVHLKLGNYSFTQQNCRVVRENDLNNFVKFQLMHGMTAPDSKELINTLKETSKKMQKVIREFHSNDMKNIQINGKGQSVPQLFSIDKNPLSNEQESLISPFSTNKVLDESRNTISNNLLHANLQSNPLQKEKYRIIRNQGISEKFENIRENNMILDKLKKKTEKELKRLSLLEMRHREDEFDREIEKELKTIQEQIHREYDFRKQPDSANVLFLR